MRPPAHFVRLVFLTNLLVLPFADVRRASRSSLLRVVHRRRRVSPLSCYLVEDDDDYSDGSFHSPGLNKPHDHQHEQVHVERVSF
jgi:hypothetical protein